jgi:hypothetical protein
MKKAIKQFKNQVENRNYLQATNFRLTFNTMPRVAFYANECNIPGVESPVAMQSAMPNPIPQPGTNVIFEDFMIDFYVDEDLKNYLELMYWFVGISFPDSLKQIYNFQCSRENFDQPYNSVINLTSDATLLLLTSNYNVNYQVKFYDIFPYKISPINLTSKLEMPEPVTATAYFKYMYFDIRTDTNKQVTDKPIE